MIRTLSMHSIVAALLLTAAGCGGSGSENGTDTRSQDGIGDSLGDLERHDLTSDLADTAPQPLTPDDIEYRDLIQYVDPFIGTEGQGNVIPGPCVPHGMVKLSPDSAVDTGDLDAYAWETPVLEGFSHTHLQGPGGSGYGYSEILLMPVVGTPPDGKVTAAFDHANEEASPGYYAVTFSESLVKAELTASAHAGFHRYTFPANSDAWVLLDVGHTRGKSVNGRIEVVDDDEVRGFGDYSAHPIVNLMLKPFDLDVGRRKIYFHARFSAPIASTLFRKKGVVWDTQSPAEAAELAVALKFVPAADGVVEARVGISFIDEAQAQRNMETEIAALSFAEAREAASTLWNRLLNRIQVEGGRPEDLTRFYTALYHAFLAPSDFTEEGRFWVGYDGVGKVRDAGDMHYYSDDFCNWDTYRTTHPLQYLVEPETVDDQISSYLVMYQEGGWLPKCPWQATGYNRIMIGNHAVCILADAYGKGFKGFDAELAWEAMHKLSMEANEGEYLEGLAAFTSVGTLPSYVNKGYVTIEDEQVESASMTLEYAFDDLCMENMARALGKEQEAAYFETRKENWRNHWDSEVKFMRPKYANGQWLEPFDATSFDGFCEADTWIYTWSVPQSLDQLMEAMGGSEAFTTRLDQFFTEGHFDVSNEPSFHVPYLYLVSGNPWKTQKQLRQVMEASFGTSPGGLPGNDDSGATSSWFVLNALGFYPVKPAAGTYWVGSPLFQKATLYLFQSGRKLVIEARDNTPANVYVQSVSLNGTLLDRAELTHQDLIGGGTLVFQMGPEPSSWGVEKLW